MKLIRKSDLIASATESWRLAHQRRDEWLYNGNGPHPQEIFNRLAGLGDGATAEQIAAITGDDRWTANICQECGTDAPMLVAFGASEVTHPTDTACVCVDCLERARELVQA